MIADILLTFAALLITIYVGLFFLFLMALWYVATLEAMQAIGRYLIRKRRHVLLALWLLALTACSMLPPKVIETPPVCPAPRTPPPIAQLPQSLPPLSIGPTDDPAAALLQNRIDSQQAYAACLQSRNDLAKWITP